MRIVNYEFPHSSFLSVEKDMEIITNNFFKNDRLKRLLFYTTKDAYKKDIALDYVAMEIPNDFIVGFGLDYDEIGRNLKDIYVLDK